jgi:hypothetical protein
MLPSVIARSGAIWQSSAELKALIANKEHRLAKGDGEQNGSQELGDKRSLFSGTSDLLDSLRPRPQQRMARAADYALVLAILLPAALVVMLV